MNGPIHLKDYFCCFFFGSREFQTSEASLSKVFCWSRALLISLTNFAFHLIASNSYKDPYLFPFLFPRPTSSLKKEKCCIVQWKVSSSAIAWSKILLFSQLWFKKLNPFLIINCFKSLFICMFDYECGAAVTMDYAYVQVIKILHFYILKGG